MKRTKTIVAALLASACPFASVYADDLDPKELMSLSLEQLSNIEVTSVSKKSEKASETSAAIFVITQDDIRRSGATSIPEVLRLAPGVSVAQSGSHNWAVSVRGFNGQFADKLLVLIDGRSVYTPLFSGVWWDVQDTLMEDIERIEVIRGPGATLWGANAVNGVINIITKNAKDTQGGLATAGFGNQERINTGARYGGKSGENTYYRAYAKFNDRDEQYDLNSGRSSDQWHKAQSGFRADMKTSDADNITIQGDAYQAHENELNYLPSLTSPPFIVMDDNVRNTGGNILARWNRVLSKESDFTLQSYMDIASRKSAYYEDNISTFDLDFQHRIETSKRNEVIWGIDTRLVHNNVKNTLYYQQYPDSLNEKLFSAFIQDKFALIPETFFLTLGSKFEHNDYTGFEYQPSARLTWLVNEKQTAWAAVSRALHTPNLFTENGSLVLQSQGGAFLTASPNQSLDSQELIAYELGYRIQPVKSVYLDTTAFYNDYDKIFQAQVGAPYLRTGVPGGPYIAVPIPVTNENSGHSFGFEVAANWEVTNNWQLGGSYSFINMVFDKTEQVFTFKDKNPEQQFNIRSTLLLSHNVELNNTLYYVDELQALQVPEYWRFDTRVSWKPVDSVELSLVGQNLLDDKHQEFSGFIYQGSSQIGRSVYGNITVRF